MTDSPETPEMPAKAKKSETAFGKAIQLPYGFCSCPKCVGDSVFINDYPEPRGMGEILICKKCQHVWRPSKEQTHQIMTNLSKKETEGYYAKRIRTESFNRTTDAVGIITKVSMMSLSVFLLMIAFGVYWYWPK